MPEKAHLTNYAINKDAADFKITEQDIEDGTSSKRTLETVYKRLADDGVDVNLLKLKIADLIIKTLISCQPDLLHNYRTCQPNDRTFNMCFEVLGFDVLIDSDTKPWLLEVNQAPSFQTDSALDYQVKKAVIKDTFQILGVTEANRQKNLDRIIRDRELKKMHKQSTLFWNQMRGEEFAREIDERRIHQLNNLGGFYKVFPVEDHDQSFSGGLFRNSISKKAKSYYSKFEKNGNMSVAASTGHGILQNIIKQKKHQQRNNAATSNEAMAQQVSSSSQVLPSAQLQQPQHGVRMHNVTTNSSMFNMSQNQTFQMMGDQNAHPINKNMQQSGSSIKLRGMGGRQTNVYQEGGQAVKQKVFSLPRDVNGVTSITQPRQSEIQNSHMDFAQDGKNGASQQNASNGNMVGPLVLNQIVQQGKRHVSVDPHTGKNVQASPALIPNGMNNGRVYRRQSSDQHQQLSAQQQNYQQQHLQTAGLQLSDPATMMMQSNVGQYSQSVSKQDKANAWVRRMRFVMAQATQQNYVGEGGQISPILQPSIGQNTQLSNGATIHQVITQLQRGVNNEGQQLNGGHHQILIHQVNNSQDKSSNMPLHHSGKGTSQNFNTTGNQSKTPANIQQSINTIQRKGDAEITLADLKGAGGGGAKKNSSNLGNASSTVQPRQPTSNLEPAGGKSQGNRSKNGSNVSIQAVKQIKAEAFKCYLSQATQLQQKILEHHNIQQQLASADQAGNSTVVSDFSAFRPSSQEENGQPKSRDMTVVHRTSNKGTNRSKVSELQPQGTDHQGAQNLLPQATSPISKKHMTPQVLKSQLSPKDSNEIQNGRIQKHGGKSAGPGTTKATKTANTNNSMLPEVQNSLTNTVHSTANPSTQNLHQSVKFPRTNLKYSESQQQPSENQQKIYWLENQKGAQLELEQRSHPSLQLQLSPMNNKARGVAEFNHRKTVHGGASSISGQNVPQIKVSHDLQSPSVASHQLYRNHAQQNNGNGSVAGHPGSYKWSNFGEHVINTEMLQQTHHRVQDLKHFEVQQQAASSATNNNLVQQQKSTSQSQMQHFQKKSASVPAGSVIQRAANTTGTMPSIHKQVAFPNLKTQGGATTSHQVNELSTSQVSQPTQKVKINSRDGSSNANMKNYIQIMQNTTGERNQLLLVSNPDLIVKKGLHSSGLQQELSLPSPVTTTVKPKEIRTTGSSGSLHMKTNSMPASTVSPVKRSLDGRGSGAAANYGALPATTTPNNNNLSSAQPN